MKKKFEIISVDGDGHCLFHSILFLVSDTYKKYTSYHSKLKAVVLFRKKLAEYLEKKDKNGISVYQKLNNQYPIGEYYEELKLENMIKDLLSSKSLGFGYYELISKYIGYNLFFIDKKTKKIMKTHDEDVRIKKNREYLLILFDHISFGSKNENGHYEPIVCTYENKIKYTFSNPNYYKHFLS